MVLKHNLKNKSSLLAILGLTLIFGFALWYSVTQLGGKSKQEIPSAGDIKISGHIVCLPHKDTSGPQTLECAFGLRDGDGRYFALRDSDPTYKNISGVGTESRVEIEGKFTPQDDSKYQSIGVIEVNKLTEVITEDLQLKNLPADVLPEQIWSKYSVDGNIYAYVIQNNANYHIPALTDKVIKWHGVLRSKDNGQSWEKFFTVSNPKDPDTGNEIKYNPVGGFFENSKMYIDIANDQGAGSGEGQLIRFSTSDDGEKWVQEGCYYFIPERYYPDYAQGKTDTLSPHDLDESENCIY
jgi:hypothetical protein